MKYENNLILVVDDDSLFRKFIINAISHYVKAYTIEANDPSEADEYLEKNIPDLILLDIEMPVMDGFHYLKKLRANERTKNIRVIPCTSVATKNLVISMSRLGIDYFLDKTANKSIMVEKIKQSLDKVNAEREKSEQNVEKENED